MTRTWPQPFCSQWWPPPITRTAAARIAASIASLGTMRRTCKHCGRFMSAGRTKPKVYCRTRCRVAAHRRRVAEAKAAEPVYGDH